MVIKSALPHFSSETIDIVMHIHMEENRALMTLAMTHQEILNLSLFRIDYGAMEKSYGAIVTDIKTRVKLNFSKDVSVCDSQSLNTNLVARGEEKFYIYLPPNSSIFYCT